VLKPGARIAFTVWATPEENTASTFARFSGLFDFRLLQQYRIDGQAERFRRDENLAIPIAAVLARGRQTAD
jgi:hypothetical protein